MVMINPLLKLFGQSPFGPLQEHMRVVVHCADKVPGLFDALCAGDEKKIHEIRDAIFALENKADKIKNELRSHLPKSYFMPVDGGVRGKRPSQHNPTIGRSQAAS